MKYLVLFYFSLALISCGNSKNQVTETNTREVRNQENPDQSCALKIAFINKGSGIDHEVKKELETYLTEKQKGGKLEFTSQNKGREGERNYCISFRKVEDSEYNDIKEKLEELVNKSNLVKFLD